MEYIRLSDCSKYSSLRTKNITAENYISTENMLPDKGGIVGIESIPDVKSASKYEINDILLSNIRPYFKKIWHANCEGSCSNDVLVVKTTAGYSSKFVYYVLCDNNFFNYATVTAKGTKMPRGSKDAIMKYLVPRLDIDTQERIASILSTYDDLIENNNRRIRLLEQMAENLYKEWFSYSKIKQAGAQTRLADIISIVRGLSYTSEEIAVDEGVNLVNLKNIQSYGGFRRDGIKLYGGKYKDVQIVRSWDLIMGVTDMTQDRRTVGSVALVPNLEHLSVISADLVKIISKTSNLFLFAMFKYGNVSRYVSQFANGANVLHLKPQDILKIKILFPNQELIDKYVQIVTPFFDEIENLSTCNNNLVKQRDMLLPRLMSGKLEV